MVLLAGVARATPASRGREESEVLCKWNIWICGRGKQLNISVLQMYVEAKIHLN